MRMMIDGKEHLCLIASVRTPEGKAGALIEAPTDGDEAALLMLELLRLVEAVSIAISRVPGACGHPGCVMYAFQGALSDTMRDNAIVPCKIAAANASSISPEIGHG